MSLFIYGSQENSDSRFSEASTFPFSTASTFDQLGHAPPANPGMSKFFSSPEGLGHSYQISCHLLYADPAVEEQKKYIHPSYATSPSVQIQYGHHFSEEFLKDIPSTFSKESFPYPVYGGKFLPAVREAAVPPIPSLPPIEEEMPKKKKKTPDAAQGVPHPLPLFFPRFAYWEDGPPLYYTLTHPPPSIPSLSSLFLRPSSAASLPFRLQNKLDKPHTPPARSGHVMAVMDTDIIMFGGLGNTGDLNDTWALDPSTRAFRPLCVAKKRRRLCGRRGTHATPSPAPPAAAGRAFLAAAAEGGEDAREAEGLSHPRPGNPPCRSVPSRAAEEGEEEEEPIQCPLLHSSCCTLRTPPAGFGQAFAVFHPRHDPSPSLHTSETTKEEKKAKKKVVDDEDAHEASCPACTGATTTTSTTCGHSHMVLIGGYSFVRKQIEEVFLFCAKTEQWAVAQLTTALPAFWGAAAQTLKQPRVLRSQCRRCHRWKRLRSVSPTASASPSREALSFWFGHYGEEGGRLTGTTPALLCSCGVRQEARKAFPPLHPTQKKQHEEKKKAPLPQEGSDTTNPWDAEEEKEALAEESEEDAEEEEVVTMFGGMFDEKMVDTMFIFHLERPLQEADIKPLSHLILTGFPLFMESHQVSSDSALSFASSSLLLSSVGFGSHAEIEATEDVLHSPLSPLASAAPPSRVEASDAFRPTTPTSSSSSRLEWLQEEVVEEAAVRRRGGRRAREDRLGSLEGEEAEEEEWHPDAMRRRMLRAAVGKYLVEVIPLHPHPDVAAPVASPAMNEIAWVDIPSFFASRSYDGGLERVGPADASPPPSPHAYQPGRIPVVHLCGPTPRRRPCSVVYETYRFIVFGGRTEGTFFNDLWEFHAQTRLWRLLPPKNVITSRFSPFWEGSMWESGSTFRPENAARQANVAPRETAVQGGHARSGGGPSSPLPPPPPPQGGEGEEPPQRLASPVLRSRGFPVPSDTDPERPRPRDREGPPREEDASDRFGAGSPSPLPPPPTRTLPSIIRSAPLERRRRSGQVEAARRVSVNWEGPPPPPRAGGGGDVAATQEMPHRLPALLSGRTRVGSAWEGEEGEAGRMGPAPTEAIDLPEASSSPSPVPRAALSFDASAMAAGDRRPPSHRLASSYSAASPPPTEGGGKRLPRLLSVRSTAPSQDTSPIPPDGSASFSSSSARHSFAAGLLPVSPSPRTGASMALDAGQGLLLMTGGFREMLDGHRTMRMEKDFWVYDLRREVWVEGMKRLCRLWHPVLDGAAQPADERGVGEWESRRRGPASAPSEVNDTVGREAAVWEELMGLLPSDTIHPPLHARTGHPEAPTDGVLQWDAHGVAAHRQRAAMTMASYRPWEAYLTGLVADEPHAPSWEASGSRSVSHSTDVIFPSFQPFFPYFSSFFGPQESAHRTRRGASHTNESRWPPLLSSDAVHFFHFPTLFPHSRSMSALVAAPTCTRSGGGGGGLHPWRKTNHANTPTSGKEEGPQRFFLFGGRFTGDALSDFFELTIRPPSVEQTALDKVWVQIQREDVTRVLSASRRVGSSLPTSTGSSASVTSSSPDHKGGALSKTVQDLNRQWFQARSKMMLSHLDHLSRQAEVFYSRVSLSSRGLCASAVQWLKTAEACEKGGKKKESK